MANAPRSSAKTTTEQTASATNKRALVIVESPAKAKTINKYLGNEYIVKSSVGHVRDLPTGGSANKTGEKKPATRTKLTDAEKQQKQQAAMQKTATAKAAATKSVTNELTKPKATSSVQKASGLGGLTDMQRVMIFVGIAVVLLAIGWAIAMR